VTKPASADPASVIASLLLVFDDQEFHRRFPRPDPIGALSSNALAAIHEIANF
jgi:hypothetical protein